METLEAIAGALLHVGLQLITAVLAGMIIGNRISGVPIEVGVLLGFVLVVLALVWMHITAIIRPRVHAFRKGATNFTTKSTSPAHSVADVTLALLGASLVWVALTGLKTPAFGFSLGWGCAHLALAALQLSLRAIYRRS